MDKSEICLNKNKGTLFVIIILMYLWIISVPSNIMFIPLITLFVLLLMSYRTRSLVLTVDKYSAMWFLIPLSVMISQPSMWLEHRARPICVFLLFAILICVSLRFSPDSFRNVLYSIRTISIILSISTIVEHYYPSIFLNGLYYLFGENNRTYLINTYYDPGYCSGVFCSPMFAAMFLSLSVFAVWIIHDRIWLAESLVIIVALGFTGNRSVIIGVMGSIFIYLLFVEKNRIVKIIVMFVIAAVIILLFSHGTIWGSRITYPNGNAFERLLYIVDSIRESSNEIVLNRVTSGRYEAFGSAWNSFIKHPILGLGWGGYSETVFNFYLDTVLVDPHNTYLLFLCDSGIIGFICFLVPVIVSIRMGFSCLKIDNNGLVKFGLMTMFFFVVVGMTEYYLKYMFGCGLFFLGPMFIYAGKRDIYMKSTKVHIDPKSFWIG